MIDCLYYIIQGYKELGGEADYADLYKVVRRSYLKDNYSISSDEWKAEIRGTIERHSSDSDCFDYICDDLFYHAGHGRWGLRKRAYSYYVEKEDNGTLTSRDIYNETHKDIDIPSLENEPTTIDVDGELLGRLMDKTIESINQTRDILESSINRLNHLRKEVEFIKQYEKSKELHIPFNKVLLYKVEDVLDISMRTDTNFNNNGIVYIGDLIQRSEADIEKLVIRDEMNSIKMWLNEYELKLGVRVNNWPIENVEMLSNLVEYEDVFALAKP